MLSKEMPTCGWSPCLESVLGPISLFTPICLGSPWWSLPQAPRGGLASLGGGSAVGGLGQGVGKPQEGPACLCVNGWYSQEERVSATTVQRGMSGAASLAAAPPPEERLHRRCTFVPGNAARTTCSLEGHRGLTSCPGKGA